MRRVATVAAGLLAAGVIAAPAPVHADTDDGYDCETFLGQKLDELSTAHGLIIGLRVERDDLQDEVSRLVSIGESLAHEKSAAQDRADRLARKVQRQRVRLHRKTDRIHHLRAVVRRLRGR